MHFRIDDRIQVELIGDAHHQPFPSKIIGVANQSIYILAPHSIGVPLEVGSALKIAVSKKGDALYECVAKIAEIIEDDATDGLNILKIIIPSTLHRNQRRAYVRVDVRIPVEILYFLQDGLPITAFTVNTVNLSAGGVRIETPKLYSPGYKLRLAILLPHTQEVEEVMVNAEVVRSEVVTRGPANAIVYETALRFTKIPQINMKKILKFVYKQQELLAKSLI